MKLIEELEKAENVAGVVLRINSPGGSATASEKIRQALVKLVAAKPTVISMGNMAASGGYWISCIGVPMLAEKGTVTGSIGVFTMKITTGVLMRRLGLPLEAISLDDAALDSSPQHVWSDSAVARIQKGIDLTYDRFLTLVSKTRGIPVADLHKLAGGRVWSGTQALENNLVDQIGGVDTCIAMLAKKAGLGSDFTVAHRPVAKTGLNLAGLVPSNEGDDILLNLPESALKLLRTSNVNLNQTRLLLNDAVQNREIPTLWLMSPHEVIIK